MASTSGRRASGASALAGPARASPIAASIVFEMPSAVRVSVTRSGRRAADEHRRGAQVARRGQARMASNGAPRVTR